MYHIRRSSMEKSWKGRKHKSVMLTINLVLRKYLSTCQGLEVKECPADNSNSTFHLPYDAVFYFFQYPAEEENVCPVMDCFCTCLVSATYIIAVIMR